MKAAARTSCDKKDRHVLAAADYSPAQTLVTFNLKDFPDSSTVPLGIEIKHPDDFLLDVFDLAPGRVATICYTALLSYKEYPQTPEDEGVRTESWTFWRPDWSPHVFDGGSAQGR